MTTSTHLASSSDFGDTVTDFSATDKIDYDNSEGSLSYLAINGATGVAFESVSANSTIADGTTVVELTGATNSAGDAAGLVTALGSSATNSSLATDAMGQVRLTYLSLLIRTMEILKLENCR